MQGAGKRGSPLGQEENDRAWWMHREVLAVHPSMPGGQSPAEVRPTVGWLKELSHWEAGFLPFGADTIVMDTCGGWASVRTKTSGAEAAEAEKDGRRGDGAGAAASTASLSPAAPSPGCHSHYLTVRRCAQGGGWRV